MKQRILWGLLGALCVVPVASAQMDCPMHKQHTAQQPTPGVMERGEEGMGFSQEKTQHHFLLFSDGGAIEVQAKDASDAALVDTVRGHLTHVAEMFSAGDFHLPMFIHDQVPPGAAVMEERKDKIHYQFEKTADGARVRITTSDQVALDAVHEFLRFQIADHATGDGTGVKPASSF